MNALFVVKPRIDRKNLAKKTIRTGQMLRVEADVKGEPAPTVTWSLKEQQLTSTERLVDTQIKILLSVQKIVL